MTALAGDTRKVLVVAPAFNEQEILPAFLDQFLALRAQISASADLRVLIVNDGSVDGTEEILRRFSEKESQVIGWLSFPSNFGHQKALIAGLMNIGDWPDCVITMDSDLEHPLSLLPEMIQLWNRERPVMINTFREEHEDLGSMKRLLSRLFYRTTAGLTGLDLDPGQADYRLWDATILRAVQSYLPHVGSLRVFSAWLRGKKLSLRYRQELREGRRSRFTFRKNLEFWKIGIVRFSPIPLKVIALSGFAGLLFSFIYGLVIVANYLRGSTVPGWSSLILVVLFMGCIQLISLGVLASYLNRLVFAKDLPSFVISRKEVGWSAD